MAGPIVFERVTPTLCIFDVVKADEFYLGFLGFAVESSAEAA